MRLLTVFFFCVQTFIRFHFLCPCTSPFTLFQRKLNDCNNILVKKNNENGEAVRLVAYFDLGV